MGSANVLRNQKGISIAKLLIGLVIIAIILYVGIRYILIRVHYLSIKDTVRAQVEAGTVYPDAYIKREIVQRASESNVVLVPDQIVIDRLPGERLTISFSYTDSLNLLVKTIYFDFDIEETSELPR